MEKKEKKKYSKPMVKNHGQLNKLVHRSGDDTKRDGGEQGFIYVNPS